MKRIKPQLSPAWRIAAYALSLAVVLSVNVAFAAGAALILA